ncbi:MAG: putative signal transducing protein [Bacillota bacterium]
MPICPNCENEYQEGVTVCPDCEVELVDNSEFRKNLTTPEDYEVIYTTSAEYEAEMLRANLEGAGIEALIVPKKDRNFPAVGDLAVIDLLVKKENAQEASQIIKDINTNNNPITDENP